MAITRCYTMMVLTGNLLKVQLRELAEDENQALYRATKFNQVDYAATYNKFLYQASSWIHPRRMVFKIEKPYG